jgi:hypothetical protein
MTMNEMHQHYKTWTELGRKLNINLSMIHYYRKIGYIPFAKQCVIEKITNGLFKASIEDINK